ncbi:hypothetical protein EYZ11_004921 [Aspergillus tanneri]|uniref:Small subunit (SSU) processome component n=1 Tax=Aspergillus tanneri TaxID=1220188 RepID=A0A4S3JJB3_9EURO|nr:Small subunit (SSU) processome component [Aspergillus tanneri]KAA8648771.1 Small subunit (SSU) processome component [Aspergillus tanneri]THC95606.1 hypothetical protein EYZ11_004921 [Aspergillus tanneri]
MGKKASRPPASKTSAASLAVSGLSYSGNQSSILKASFAPSDYQLALFASVIQGLEGQHLRIHDTNTGRLQCEHVLAPRETVTSLDWGYFPSKQRDQSKKKRKRHSDVNGPPDGLDHGDVVVAFGTSASDIRMYSPAEDKVIGTLMGAHEEGIKDFKFTLNRPGQEGWSIGCDNKLVQWDLRTGKTTKMIHLSSSVLSSLSRPLPSNPPIICASQKPYIVDVENDVSPIAFSDMRNPIQHILASSTQSAATGLFLASDNDRFINVYDVQSQKLVMNLVADKEVSSLSLYTATGNESGDELSLEKQVLAAVTDDGTIELFTRPFVKPNELLGSKSLKAKRQHATKRSDSSIKITRSEASNTLATVVTVEFQGPELIIACAEGGVVPVFERVRWLNEDTDELAFTGTKTITKTKSGSALGSVTANGRKNVSETYVDESRAVVEQGNFAEDDVEMEDSKENAVSIADNEEDDSDDEPQTEQSKEKPQKEKEADGDVEMGHVDESDQGDEEDEETGEPSFGELMRAHTSGEIDVEAELEDGVRIGSLVPGKPSTAVQPIPSGVSLSTVLTQSLKTNDTDMLESCFHTGEISVIRTTIQRLEPSLAATLLQKLAERLSARPGRYGHLLVWVQWTCVAHGGALAGKPDLLKRMSSLFKVMDQRSSSLSSLLLLKGKLDMLDAQLGLRQSIRSRAEDMDSEDEEDIIYVEGQEEEEDSDADTKLTATPRTKLIRGQTFDEDESMVNGVQSGIDESDDEEDVGSEDEDDENQDVFDVEAEESAGSSDAEESPEEDEDEDDEDADSAGSMADFIADTEDDVSEVEGPSVSQPPPPKKAKLSGGKGKNKARK